MRNSLKMDVLDELRLFREKRLSNSTFCTPVSYSNLNMNLNLKLESETVERIVVAHEEFSRTCAWIVIFNKFYGRFSPFKCNYCFQFFNWDYSTMKYY